MKSKDENKKESKNPFNLLPKDILTYLIAIGELTRDDLAALRGTSKSMSEFTKELKSSYVNPVIKKIKRARDKYMETREWLTSEEARGPSRMDEEVILSDVKKEDLIVDRLQTDKNFILDAVKVDTENIDIASPVLLQDEAFVLELVQINGLLLEKAPLFQNNKKIVLAALTNNEFATTYTDKSLLNDKPFMLEAIAHNWKVIYSASEALKNDLDVIIEVIKRGDEVGDMLFMGEKITASPELWPQLQSLAKMSDKKDRETACNKWLTKHHWITKHQHDTLEPSDFPAGFFKSDKKTPQSEEEQGPDSTTKPPPT